jgi:hypothetical protein
MINAIVATVVVVMPYVMLNLELASIAMTITIVFAETEVGVDR